MKSLLALVSVISLGAGCDVRGGNLTGTGGGTLATGAGGATVMTGSGGGIVTGNGGAGLGGAAGRDDPANWCGREFPLAPLAPDIMVVLDTSASMNDGFDGPCASGCGSQSKWSAARSVVESVVVADSPHARWGLQLFTPGGGDACAPGGVTVAIDDVTATSIRSALSRRGSGGMLVNPGNRPTRAAIDSAMAHVATRATGGSKAILLITDGVPDCPGTGSDPLASDVAGAVQAITQANTAGFPTLVAGMAIAPGAEASLSQMALAGGRARAGSPAYYPISSGADLAAVVSGLLAQTATCTFEIPPPPTNDGTSSRDRIFVRIDGLDVPRDAQNGWIHADASHATLQLNGSACDLARADGIVSVGFLCLLF